MYWSLIPSLYKLQRSKVTDRWVTDPDCIYRLWFSQSERSTVHCLSLCCCFFFFFSLRRDDAQQRELLVRPPPPNLYWSVNLINNSFCQVSHIFNSTWTFNVKHKEFIMFLSEFDRINLFFYFCVDTNILILIMWLFCLFYNIDLQ